MNKTFQNAVRLKKRAEAKLQGIGGNIRKNLIRTSNSLKGTRFKPGNFDFLKK